MPLFRAWAPCWVFVRRATAAARFHFYSYHDVLDAAYGPLEIVLSCQPWVRRRSGGTSHTMLRVTVVLWHIGSRSRLETVSWTLSIPFPSTLSAASSGWRACPAWTLAPVWSSRPQTDAQSGGGTASCKQEGRRKRRLSRRLTRGGRAVHSSTPKRLARASRCCASKSMAGFPKGSTEAEGAPIGSRA